MGAQQQIFLGWGGSAPAGNALDVEILADSPWAYYQLGESAGATTYVDSSGNTRDLATLAATLTAGSTALCAPGTSVDFDGNAFISSSNNQYGTAQATAFNGDKALTFCAVVNVDTLAASCIPVHLGNASVANSQGVFVQILTTGAIRFQLYDTTGPGYKFHDTATGLITAGASNIIHVRREVGGATAIFLNGTSVATGTMSGTIGMAATASSGGQRIMLGALNAATPSTRVNGKMQHIAMFTTALSDARIAAHATASGL